MAQPSAYLVRPREVVCFLAVLLAVAAPLGQDSSGAKPGPNVIAPTALSGKKVAIELQSGEKLDIEILAVVEGAAPGSISLVSYRDAASGNPRSLLASAISSLAPEGNAVRYTFDKQTMRLLPDDPAEREKIRQNLADPKARSAPQPKAAEPAPATDNKEAKKEDKKGGKGDKSSAKNAGKKGDMKYGKLMANGEELPLQKGVKYWPEQSKEDRAKAIAEHKEHLKKIQALFPNSKFTFVETEFYLFYSDLPPADLKLYIPYMDAMYRRLLAFFEIKDRTNIWRGKASVVIFATRESFVTYARDFQKLKTTGEETGRCFQQRNGDVVTGLHTTESDRKFIAQAIVHETTHGFVWRYKTRCDVPSWVNEGLAEHIAALVVPGSMTISERLAIQNMRGHGSVGKGFWDGQINADQYGVAYSLTRYMIAADANRYKMFFESLKSGMKEEECLQKVYGIRREVLLQQFGRSFGVPNLQP